jgi:splicing factor 3B subunit 1
VRQQSADLIGKIAAVMKRCGEDQLLNHLGVVLYEYLGEEYPEVLGSILGGLKGIVNVVGMSKMTPPIKDLLPRLTPILRNRHEKVQENCIDLVGRIADRGAEFVSAKEWMRICFELLDMLKAHKKAIRRATVNTFGYIAKAIGPQDVLAVLLNNLKVQERQNRVCTTVAIAIVAETCGPFTVRAPRHLAAPRVSPTLPLALLMCLALPMCLVLSACLTRGAPARRRCCPRCSTSTASRR